MAEKHLMLTRCIIACVGYLMQVSNACSSQSADLSLARWLAGWLSALVMGLLGVLDERLQGLRVEGASNGCGIGHRNSV
jgi:hypothetical protein